MWRHITGVKRPAETNNQQKDEDESKKSKRRRFNTKWTIGDNGKVREWLIYDRSNVTDEMYCISCTDVHESSAVWEDATPVSERSRDRQEDEALLWLCLDVRVSIKLLVRWDEIKQSWRWLRGGVSSSQLVDLQAHTNSQFGEK